MSTQKIITKLEEIREACGMATSMEDTNLNEIIEEIDRLAVVCINKLENE